jgi:CBS-domain-containing membrane protein
MKRNPQVIAFMTPFPYSIDVDAPLKEAHKLMREHHFPHLPVTRADAIVGVLTDRDIRLVLEETPWCRTRKTWSRNLATSGNSPVPDMQNVHCRLWSSADRIASFLELASNDCQSARNI